MRLLYLPLLAPGGASEQYDLIDVLKNRFTLSVLDYLSSNNPTIDLMQRCEEFKPDIIHGQYQETNKISPEILFEIKSRWPSVLLTQWCGDIRATPIKQVVDLGRQCDLTLISNTGQLSEYRDVVKKPVRYWQNAVGPRFFTTATYNGGIVFCGNRYGHFPLSCERDTLVDAFRKKGNFRLYGSGWESSWGQPIAWERQPEVYRDARVILGHNHVNASGFFSDRQLIAMASGVPHLCRYSPELEDTFDNWKDCVFYTSVDDAIEKAQWLIDHPTHAQCIGIAGRERINREHTWEVRVSEFEQLIKELT